MNQESTLNLKIKQYLVEIKMNDSKEMEISSLIHFSVFVFLPIQVVSLPSLNYF